MNDTNGDTINHDLVNDFLRTLKDKEMDNAQSGNSSHILVDEFLHTKNGGHIDGGKKYSCAK
jgi:hypothetical protein